MIGSWKLEGTTLKLGRIGSTMMMCSPEAMKVEAAFLEKLGRASAATLLDGRLVLWDEAGERVLTLDPSAS